MIERTGRGSTDYGPSRGTGKHMMTHRKKRQQSAAVMRIIEKRREMSQKDYEKYLKGIERSQDGRPTDV